MALIVAKQLAADKRISATAKLLLAQLLEHHNKKTGQCNPRRAVLARELGVSVPTISRALSELREAGLIRSTKRPRTNDYNFVSDQIRTTPASRVGSNPHGMPDQIDPAEPAVSLLTEPTSIEPIAAASSVGTTGATPAPPPAAAGPKPKPMAREEGTLSIVRDSLYGLAREVSMPLPDEDLVRMVVSAARGAPGENIQATLVALWKRGRFKSMRSWGLVPILVASCYDDRHAAVR